MLLKLLYAAQVHLLHLPRLLFHEHLRLRLLDGSRRLPLALLLPAIQEALALRVKETLPLDPRRLRHYVLRGGALTPRYIFLQLLELGI